jgi:hypothetical protein
VPSQISHLSQALGFLDIHPEFERTQFLVGALFPDIRRIGNIPHEMTHTEGAPEADIFAQTDSFMAGLRHHSLMDDEWGEYFEVFGATPYMSEEMQVFGNSLKMYEDELLYPLRPDLQEVIGYLGRVLPQEQNYGLTDEIIRRWHRAIGQIVLKGVAKAEDRREFMVGIGMSEDLMIEHEKQLAAIRADYVWRGRVERRCRQLTGAAQGRG